MSCSIRLGAFVKVKVSANDRSLRASLRAASARSQENQQEKLPDSAKNYWCSFGILMLIRVTTSATSKKCAADCSVVFHHHLKNATFTKQNKKTASLRTLFKPKWRELYKWLAATARQLLWLPCLACSINKLLQAHRHHTVSKLR
jgi:hypothetical protein